MRKQQVPIPQHPGFEPSPVEGDFLHFQCSVCLELPLNPVIPECGHHYCRKCAEGIHKPECCLCRKPWKPEEWQSLEDGVHSITKRLYCQYLVTCLACKSIVPRGYRGELFEEHVQQCKMSCPSCACDTNRASIQAHFEVCPNVFVSCSADDLGCKVWAARSKVMEHEQGCVRLLLAPAVRDLRERADLSAALQAQVAEQTQLALRLDRELNELKQLFKAEVIANRNRIDDLMRQLEEQAPKLELLPPKGDEEKKPSPKRPIKQLKGDDGPTKQ